MRSTNSAIRLPKLSEDVLSFSECRRTLADCIEKTRRTHRPILVTQNGTATSALINIADLEKLWEALELEQDVRAAEAELDAGLGIPHDQVMRELNDELESMRRKMGI